MTEGTTHAARGRAGRHETPARGPWSAFRALVVRLEELPVGPAALAAALVAIMALRNLLEPIVAQNPAFHALSAFVHYPLAYVAPFLGLTLLLAAWSGVAVVRVARLMLLAWTLTLLPPLADLVLHHTKSAPAIGYLAADPADLGYVYANFLNPAASFTGTTPGIRIEILAAVVLGFVYILLRSRSWGRAIAGGITVYPASLFFLTLPVLVLGVCRWFKPDATRVDLLWGEALLNRPDYDTSPDSVAVLWLVPLVLLFAAAFWALERRAARRGAAQGGAAEEGRSETWLHGAGGASIAPGWTLFMGLLVLGGALAALRIHLPIDRPLLLAPYDVLGTLGGVLAVVLPAAAILRPAAAPHVRAGLALLGAALVAAFGRGFAMPWAAGVAALLLFGAAWIPARVAPWVRGLAGAVAGLGAFGAGYALAIGVNALARAPWGLWVGALVVGAAAGFAGGRTIASGEARPYGLGRAWPRVAGFGGALGVAGYVLGGVAFGVVGAVAGAVLAALGGFADDAMPERARGTWTLALAAGAFVLLLRVATMVPSTREPLVAQATCIARLRVIEAEKYERQKNWATAKTFYFEALKCDADDPAALRGLALGLLHNEGADKFDRALELLEKAARLRPDSASDLSNLASAYIQAGRFDDALPLLDKAVALDPRDPNALFNRAAALEGAGRAADAVAAWEAFVDRARPLPESAPDVKLARQRLRALREGPRKP